MTFRAVFETLPLVELPDYKGLEVKARAAAGRRTRRWTRRSTACARRPRATTPSRAGRRRRATSSCSTSTCTRDDGTRQAATRTCWSRSAPTDNHKDLNAALAGHVARRDARTVTLAYDADTRGRRAWRGQTVDYTVTLKAREDEGGARRGRRVRQGPRRVRQPGRAAGQACAQQLLAADERQVDREVKDALVEALVAARRLRGARTRWSSAT